MKWFRKLVWRVTKRAWEDNDEFEAEELNTRRANRNKARLVSAIGSASGRVYATEDRVSEDHSLRARSMHFKLYKCVGGHILETSVYNRHDDDHEHTLYMIKEEDDFAQQIAQSIMLEMMKQ